MKYRSRIEIVAELLRSAMHGASKTRLMYGALLSYSQLVEYLDFCNERDLLICEEGIYRLSERGLLALRKYEELEELLAVKEAPVPVLLAEVR